MSSTVSEPVIHLASRDSTAVRKSIWTRWPRWILAFLLFVWAADIGISLLIQHTPLHQRLTARLVAAFGRPVDVRRYNFSMWGGPTLEAEGITVGEDPRFGNEYFLRAESLTARLRWQSLLLGHLEFATLSLTQPSLNLVRTLEGDWNIEEWLPRPSGIQEQTAPFGPARPSTPSALRVSRIEVEAGRINFKSGDDKVPFAFVGVNGYLEPESPGRWRMDLDATPTRAGVVVQQTGTLHLAGHLGGTSSRLRPAVLDVSWTGASISDVLRLARSHDYGLRGSLALSIGVRTEGDDWMLQSRVQLQQLHRWDLAARVDNPSLNLIANGKLDLVATRLDLTGLVLEAPHSNIHAVGAIDWSLPGNSLALDPAETELQVASSVIGLTDVLPWVRAFHSGVANDLTLTGLARGDVKIHGWPPQVDQGLLAIEGAELQSPRLRVPVRLNAAQIRFDANGIHFEPSAVFFGAAANPPVGVITLDQTPERKSKASSTWRLAGQVREVRDLVATTGALGWNLSRGWDLAGPAAFEFQWMTSKYPWQALPIGNVDWGDGPGFASLRAPFLNHPVEQIRARLDFRPDSRSITLRSADAFGARWNGSFDRRGMAGEWEFSLSADRLSAGEIDRWLNPRWRETFFDRMLPFLNSNSQPNAEPENLRSSGKIHVDQFTLAPALARRLEGELKITGRHLELTNAKAQFFGGEIDGSLDAELGATPLYEVNFDFTRVDLSALAAASPGLANLFAGAASGKISLAASGSTRAEMLESLECQGAARVNNAELRSLNLFDSLRKRTRQPGISLFRDVSAAFTCGDGEIQFQELRLRGASAELDAAGSVDFTRRLNLHVHPLPSPIVTHDPRPSAASEETYDITGTLAAPDIKPIPAPAHQP